MTLDEISGMYALLSDSTRLRILNLLRGGPLCACHIVAALELPQSTVSRHLSWLKIGGLINLNQHERYSIYSLNNRAATADTISDAAHRAAGSEQGRADLGRLRAALRELPNKYVERTE